GFGGPAVPQSISHGLKREHVLKALAELASGAEHPFGPPTGYELVHEGKRFAPKAVVGLAYRHATGRVLLPEQIAAPAEPTKPWLSRKDRRLDFALRDPMNRQLGKLGEDLVVRFERQRLRQAGRDDLAD